MQKSSKTRVFAALISVTSFPSNVPKWAIWSDVKAENAHIMQIDSMQQNNGRMTQKAESWAQGSAQMNYESAAAIKI